MRQALRARPAQVVQTAVVADRRARAAGDRGGTGPHPARDHPGVGSFGDAATVDRRAPAGGAAPPAGRGRARPVGEGRGRDVPRRRRSVRRRTRRPHDRTEPLVNPDRLPADIGGPARRGTRRQGAGRGFRGGQVGAHRGLHVVPQRREAAGEHHGGGLRREVRAPGKVPRAVRRGAVPHHRRVGRTAGQPEPRRPQPGPRDGGRPRRRVRDLDLGESCPEPRCGPGNGPGSATAPARSSRPASNGRSRWPTPRRMPTSWSPRRSPMATGARSSWWPTPVAPTSARSRPAATTASARDAASAPPTTPRRRRVGRPRCTTRVNGSTPVRTCDTGRTARVRQRASL